MGVGPDNRDDLLILVLHSFMFILYVCYSIRETMYDVYIASFWNLISKKCENFLF